MNWYGYAAGNPIGFVDPMGLGIDRALNAVQNTLSFLGMIPVYGAVFDIVNAGVSIGRGNYVDAAINFASAMPGFGDAVGGAKILAGGAAAYGGYKAVSRLSRVESYAAKSEVTVCRVFGGDARAQGFSWTTTHPESVSNFRNLAGLPSGGASGATNSAEFLIQGKASVGDIIKSRSALPLDGNVGGLPELIIDPKNVRITDFSVIKP